jgi:hypothetical protein
MQPAAIAAPSLLRLHFAGSLRVANVGAHRGTRVVVNALGSPGLAGHLREEHASL